MPSKVTLTDGTLVWVEHDFGGLQLRETGLPLRLRSDLKTAHSKEAKTEQTPQSDR